MDRTILLADDSVTIQKVVELTFMDEGYEVVTVGDGDEALRRMAEMDADLVIADVHMPGADGLEVCRRAKEAAPDRPVLLLVGTFEPFEEDEAEEAGADAFLKKPFDSQELTQRVESLLATPTGTVDSDAAVADAETAELGVAEERVEPMETESDAWTEPDEFEVSPWTAAEEEAEAEGEADWERPEGLVTTETSGGVDLDTEPEVATSEDVIPPVDLEASGAEAEAEAVTPGDNGALSEAEIDRIARRVVEVMSEEVVREVAWEVVPDLAEVVIKDRIRELERQLE